MLAQPAQEKAFVTERPTVKSINLNSYDRRQK